MAKLEGQAKEVVFPEPKNLDPHWNVEPMKPVL